MASTEKRAIIFGTSLLHTDVVQKAHRFQVETAHGKVNLLEFHGLILLQRHGLDEYCPPHRINHHAHLLALHQSGVQTITAMGSVGSLHIRLPPGSVVVPDDFYAPHITPTFYQDGRGHQLPGFDPSLRNDTLKKINQPPLPPPIDGGVYWQTNGPRFETPAEIRFHATHVNYVGMTLASECILAAELQLPYAAVCIVDNYANGVGKNLLTLDSFKQHVTDNKTLAQKILSTLMELP